MSEPQAAASTSRYAVGERLRQRRRALGLTQQQLVERLADLSVPMTNKAMSSLERGAGLDAARLPGLARALDCSVTYLLGLSRDPQRWQPDRWEPARWQRDRSHPSPQRRPASRSEARDGPWILGPDVPGTRLGAPSAARDPDAAPGVNRSQTEQGGVRA